MEAMDEWLEFFRPHFDSETETVRFVEECESQSSPANTAKILMHQTQRLVSLADQVLEIRPYDESLHVLFLIMCSENISKLQDGYVGEGKSRTYVRRFFERFLSQADKDFLGMALLMTTISRLALTGLLIYSMTLDVTLFMKETI
jgi:hypothetical protein